jgi:hypothetical protein
MNKWLFLLILILPWRVIAQQGSIVQIDGNAQVEYPDNKSRLQVEKEAEEQATVNALENAFGRAVVESNTTYLTNLNTGVKVETSTVFNMIANTYVKGEVLEVLNRKFEEVPGIKIVDGKKVEIRDLRCTLLIKAREITETPLDFESFTMACVHIKCRTTDFKDHDPFYLYFKSPATGYLTVFLDDTKKCQRLLPYLGMAEKFEDGVPINADQEYFLFTADKKHTYFSEGYKADEYILDAENIQDQNKIFIIFSRTPVPKPSLQKGMGDEDLSKNEKRDGWKVPKALSSEDFQRWLMKNRYHNQNIQVKTIDITITK